MRPLRYLPGRMLALTRRRRSPRVVIVGAGFGGLAAAVALRRRGIDDVTIIERSDGVGGTWRRNVYPGAACDIQSHLYSFSFAQNRGWTRTYANQPEILAYLESVADDFDLRSHLMLNTEVRTMRWDSDASHWDVELFNGDTMIADVVVSAVGLFGPARYPDIEGLADFSGALIHTALWDESVELTGKRVGVIGTGASGVQVVPELADVAGTLTVFQRSPPWMVPKEDRPYSAQEMSRYRRLPWASWRERWRLWKFQHDNTALTPDHPRMAVVQDLSAGFLRQHVDDERLRDALTPRYPFRCKRVLLGEKFYTALQREHVDLVTDPISHVTDTAVVTA
jgi:cation diffusion facilitator CzcD-associated flavoprotein CzcO